MIYGWEFVRNSIRYFFAQFAAELLHILTLGAIPVILLYGDEMMMVLQGWLPVEPMEFQMGEEGDDIDYE